MKKLQSLKGAKALSKNEQQSINGGDGLCPTWKTCDTVVDCGPYHLSCQMACWGGQCFEM